MSEEQVEFDGVPQRFERVTRAQRAHDAGRNIQLCIGDTDIRDFTEVQVAATRHWMSTIEEWASEQTLSDQMALCAAAGPELAITLGKGVAPNGWVSLGDDQYAPSCPPCDGEGLVPGWDSGDDDTAAKDCPCYACKGEGFWEAGAIKTTMPMDEVCGEEVREFVLHMAARKIGDIMPEINKSLSFEMGVKKAALEIAESGQSNLTR